MNQTVVKSDFTALNSALSSFDSFFKAANGFGKSISSFIADSANNKLTGAGFDAVRSKLASFQEIFEKCDKLSDMTSEITSANSGIISAMGSNASITYSKSLLISLRHELSKIRVLDYYHITKDATDFERRQAYNRALNEYNKIRDDLQSQIELIENVMSAVSAADGVVGSYTSGASQSATLAASIIPTSIV